MLHLRVVIEIEMWWTWIWPLTPPLAYERLRPIQRPSRQCLTFQTIGDVQSASAGARLQKRDVNRLFTVQRPRQHEGRRSQRWKDPRLLETSIRASVQMSSALFFTSVDAWKSPGASCRHQTKRPWCESHAWVHFRLFCVMSVQQPPSLLLFHLLVKPPRHDRPMWSLNLQLS